ncbi:hypothetical protein ACO2Q1_11305 [Brevundimonas sp. VNH65]|uniref:hypothetical protein n=1 Tax=Brevundimonas sp. VNH65 TaxID=3400917 RepID=UPI003C0776F9
MTMRVSGLILIAGAGVTLAACGTTGTRPLSVADLTERCTAVRGELTPTGAQTGDPRRDFACVGAETTRVALVRSPGRMAARNTAIDRAFSSPHRSHRGY